MNPGRRKKPRHRKRRRIMPVDRFRVNCAGRKKPVQFITLGKAGKPVADKADSGKMKGGGLEDAGFEPTAFASGGQRSIQMS